MTLQIISSQKPLLLIDDWGASDIYRIVFNLAHNLNQDVTEETLNNRFEEAKNLYIVGGGTHPGSGLPTILKVRELAASYYWQTWD